MKRIEAEWLKYKNNVLGDLPDDVATALKITFFSGASAFYRLQLNGVSSDPSNAEQLMDELSDELIESSIDCLGKVPAA